MEETTLSISDLKAILLRRRWGLVLPAVALFWAAVAVAVMLPSIYRTQATILIEEQAIPTNLVQTMVTSFAEQQLQNIYQRIVNLQNLQDIIKKFNLYPELQKKLSQDEIASKMKNDIILDFVKADIIDPKTRRQATATIAFTLAYSGKHPESTQKVVSALTSLILDENLKNREKQASDTSNFLQDEANRLKEAMAETDGKIASFKEKHANELPEMMQLNIQSLSSIDDDNSKLSEQIRMLRERESFMVAQLATIPKQEVKNNRLDDLRLKLADLKTRYSDQYPDVIALKATIEKLSAEEQGRNAEAADNPTYVTLSAQLASTRSDLTSLQRLMQANEKKRIQYRSLIEATPRVEETYKALINERDNQLRKYNDLAQKLLEAQVAQGMEKDQYAGRFTIVEPARVPEKPYKPNRMAIVLIGIVLGAGAGVGTIALMEFSDQTVRSADRLTQATSFPVLGVVPEILTTREKSRKKIMITLQVVGLGILAIISLAALAAVRILF